MQIESEITRAKVEANFLQEFPALEHVTHPTVNTAATAYYLRKAQQTLRIWACKENGPIRPIRVGAHLHWKTSDIRKLLGVS